MIKRYEIRPRRKRAANGNGAEPTAAGAPPADAAPAALPGDAPAQAGPLTPTLDEK